jgi:hypothetical protein
VTEHWWLVPLFLLMTLFCSVSCSTLALGLQEGGPWAPSSFCPSTLLFLSLLFLSFLVLAVLGMEPKALALPLEPTLSPFAFSLFFSLFLTKLALDYDPPTLPS